VKRFVKYGLIFLMLVLLMGSITLAVINHNPALFKPIVEHWFKANYQRTLRMAGEIRLTLFPRVDLALSKVSLSEYQRDDLFASIEHLSLSIHVLPLLSKRLVIDNFHVTGFEAKLVRDQRGVFNIADLLEGDDESFIKAFQINRVETNDSRLSFQDESAQRAYELSGIHLTVLQVNTDSLQQIQMNGQFSVSEMNGKETIVSQVITQLEGAEIVFEQGKPIVGPVFLSLQSHPDELETGLVERFSARLSIADFGWIDTMLNSQHMHLELAMQRAAKIAKVSIDTALVFNMNEMSGELSGIHFAFDFFHPDYTSKSVHGNFEGQINLNWYTELLNMEMQGKIDDDGVNVTAQLQGFSQQHHTFNLEVDALDLTAFLPTETSGSDVEIKQFPDFSVLNNMGLNGSIQIGQLVVGDIQFSEMQLVVGSDNYASSAAQPE